MKARKPAADVAAICFVVGSEFVSQRWLFVKDYEQNDGNYSYRSYFDSESADLAEDNPQAGPSSEEAYVHRIAHIAIETYDDQTLRRSNGRRSAAACPSEVPYAAESHCETEDGRDDSHPAPECDAHYVNVETEPTRQQPEPEREESRAHDQRSECIGPLPVVIRRAHERTARRKYELQAQETTIKKLIYK